MDGDGDVEVEQLIDALIDREGGFVDHPADKGGPTCFGITEAVARAHGYAGPMRQLPRTEAAAIYRRLYWSRPRFARVLAEQRSINERTEHDFEARLAAARAHAQRLRLQPKAAANPGAGRTASVPGLPAAAGGAAQDAGHDGLPPSDALTATEQAIQLDELIKWIRQQAAVDNNPAGATSPPGD